QRAQSLAVIGSDLCRVDVVVANAVLAVALDRLKQIPQPAFEGGDARTEFRNPRAGGVEVATLLRPEFANGAGNAVAQRPVQLIARVRHCAPPWRGASAT